MILAISPNFTHQKVYKRLSFAPQKMIFYDAKDYLL